MKFITLIALVGLTVAQPADGEGGPGGPGGDGEGGPGGPGEQKSCESNMDCKRDEGECCAMVGDGELVCLAADDAMGECMPGGPEEDGAHSLAASAFTLFAVATMMN